MSDNAGIMVVSRHLPLLRMPLLLNNLVNLILSSLLSFNPIFQAQLALIPISTLAGAFDLIQYCDGPVKTGPTLIRMSRLPASQPP